MSGNLAGLLAIAMWSVANLLITFTGAVPAFMLGALVMIPGGFIGLVFVLSGLFSVGLPLVFEETRWPDSAGAWLAIAGLITIRAGYVLWDYAMTHGDAVMLASLSYLLPLFSTLLFIAFGRVPLGLSTGIGGALIIMGCITVNIPKPRAALSKRRS